MSRRGLRHVRNQAVLVVAGYPTDDGDVARRDPAWNDMGWIDPDPPDAEDVVDMGGGRWRWWQIVALLAAVLAAGTSLLIRNSADRPKSAATQPAAPFQSVTSPNPPEAAVLTTTLGHPLLHAPAGWELFARGPGVMVRVELAAGRVTRTLVPQLNSSGPVSFVVGPHQAIIRPLDFVPGYEVRDGEPARNLPGVFGAGGMAVPGPDRNHVWVETGAGRDASMRLIGFDNQLTRTSVPIPRGGNVASADGTGYLLFTLTGGVYRAGPDGLRRVTSGQLLAAGPTRWLTLECDSRHNCTPTVVDRATGRRHILPTSLVRYSGGGGVISPDGRNAALFRAEFGGYLAVHLVDLTSGAERATGVALAPPSDPQGPLVWSPDSRWLFAADSHEQLTVIDNSTGHVHFLGVGVTGVRQVAFRKST